MYHYHNYHFEPVFLFAWFGLIFFSIWSYHLSTFSSLLSYFSTGSSNLDCLVLKCFKYILANICLLNTKICVCIIIIIILCCFSICLVWMDLLQHIILPLVYFFQSIVFFFNRFLQFGLLGIYFFIYPTVFSYIIMPVQFSFPLYLVFFRSILLHHSIAHSR